MPTVNGIFIHELLTLPALFFFCHALYKDDMQLKTLLECVKHGQIISNMFLNMRPRRLRIVPGVVRNRVNYTL